MKYLLSFFAFSSIALAQTHAPLTLGRQPLNELGIYRVSYQSYGAAQVDMPSGWTGHFDAVSGISYVPSEYVQGRDAMLIHSPWHVPPGRTFVEYAIHLPNETPIVLEFGIAMRADSVLPDKSDGATFGCTIIDATGEHALLHEDYAKAEWKEFEFDLSTYAGKDITLRLQIEPGPAKNPSFDYSYFGSPAIRIGTGERPPLDIDAMLQSKSIEATADASLTRVANDAQAGVTPSNLLAYENTIEKSGEGYRFNYVGEDCRVTYTYTPNTGTLDDFFVQVDDARAFQPALGGGVTAVERVDEAETLTFLRGGRAQRVELSLDGKALDVTWSYPLRESSVVVTWRFGIRGKSLTVSARCEQPVIAVFSLGRSGNTAFRKIFGVPYLLGSVEYLSDARAFVCRYLDWTQSHATMAPQGDATYGATTAGNRNALQESGYIAVSPNVVEVLPNLPSSPSPYMAELGPRIMLDIWGHRDGTYEGDAENLRELKDNGVDHLAIISHVWQRYGYDEKLPDHIPANPQFGGDDGMKVFGKAANDCGYLWSLHENYTDLYPDAPSYDATARVLRADGSPSPGWLNTGTGVQSFGIKTTRSIGFAKQNSPEIHARYGTTAAYLDVHTCVPPWNQVDHDAAQPMAAMMLSRMQHETALFQYERDTHEGPLFGEGNNQFFWAGRCDGVEAQVSGGEDHVPFLEFDLLKLHPQMVNHGMGYYERWFRRGYSHQWGRDTGTPEQVDKYRAQEIAYGHAGFIGDAQTANIQWVAKEHHMMHPIQRIANNAKVTRVAYEVDGRMVPASIALIADQRLRQHITYDSGLQIWVNWKPEIWEVEGRELPQWGVLTIGPDTVVETVLKDGHFADFAECPEFLFVDARTSFNMPYEHARKDITPSIQSWEWLGENRVRLTYAWNVNDTIDEDCIGYVHFLRSGATPDKEIAFQNDHPTPKPTSTWRAGEVVVDGPYDITIPEEGIEAYPIAVGLYKRLRVPLKRADSDGYRVIVGTLHIKREGGVVTDVRVTDTESKPPVTDALHADFSAHLNAAGTWIEFGAIATDGSVKIERRDGFLDVLPYPRDKSFTVAIDVARVAHAPSALPDSIRVDALAALTQAELGSVAHTIKDGRIVFTTRAGQVGRYRIRW